MSNTQSASRVALFIQIGIIVCTLALALRLLMPSGPIDERIPLPKLVAAGWLNGRPPKDLSGQVVVLDIWATVCGPCIEVMPDLVKLYEKYAAQGVQFIGLTPEPPTHLPYIQAVLDANPGVQWPVGYGAVATLEKIGWDELFPTYVIFDRQGKVVFSSHSDWRLEDELVSVLAQ